MNWDDQLFTGSHGNWSWILYRAKLPQVIHLTAEHHIGHQLWTPSFQGDTIASQPIFTSRDLPIVEECEWYIFKDTASPMTTSQCYLGICGFNLADPFALAASQDPTWDRAGYDWLIPLQSQFWNDIEGLSPVSYVSVREDSVLVVSSIPSFYSRLHEIATDNVA